MSSDVVLDAGVLVGLLSATDVHHTAAVALVRRSDAAGRRLRLPVSAYAEVLLGSHRGHHDRVQLELMLSRGLVDVVPLDRPAAELAAGLRGGDLGLRLPDALVLGTGLALDADVIATTDRRWARYSDRVEVLA